MTDPGRVGRAGGPRRRSRELVPRGQLQVKVSEAERAQLRERAAQLGVTVPRLLVESALAEPDGGWVAVREQTLARRQLLTDLFELCRLTATIANNVNQLAKTANTSGDLPSSERLHQTLVEIDATLDQLRATTNAL